MADLIYYFGLKDVPYLFGGVGVFNRSNSGTVKYTTDGGDTWDTFGWKDLDTDAVKTNVAFSAGVGWNFTKNFGLELKATTSGTMTWAQGSLLYRFK
jgi:hypothetical protein